MKKSTATTIAAMTSITLTTPVTWDQVNYNWKTFGYSLGRHLNATSANLGIAGHGSVTPIDSGVVKMAQEDFSRQVDSTFLKNAYCSWKNRKGARK